MLLSGKLPATSLIGINTSFSWLIPILKFFERRPRKYFPFAVVSGPKNVSKIFTIIPQTIPIFCFLLIE